MSMDQAWELDQTTERVATMALQTMMIKATLGSPYFCFGLYTNFASKQIK